MSCLFFLRERDGLLIIWCRVSLKSKLAAKDLHRLLSDVRRKVEREVTFDGTDRRTRYVDFFG